MTASLDNGTFLVFCVVVFLLCFGASAALAQRLHLAFYIRRALARARRTRALASIQLASLAAYDAARLIRAGKGHTTGSIAVGSMSWSLENDWRRAGGVCIAFEKVYGDDVPFRGSIHELELPAEDARVIGEALIDRESTDQAARERRYAAETEREHSEARESLLAMLDRKS